MKTVIETISPKRAKELLDHNTDNRTIRLSAVSEYAHQMRNGHWLLTHQGIAIAPNGRILDGQHRLMAIVESGCHIKTSVSYDVDPESYRHMDDGIKRTVADRLALMGDKESNRIAVAVVTAYLKSTASLATSNNRVNADQVDDEFLDKTEAYVEVTELARQYHRRAKIGKSSILAAFVTYLHHSHDLGRRFVEQYFLGEGLSVGNPAYTLREATLAGRLTTEHDQYWKASAACIAHFEGRQLSTLQAASEDLLGNVYKRMALRRSERGVKAGVTRKKKSEALAEAGGSK